MAGYYHILTKCAMYDDMSLMQFVIPGLTQNQMPFWLSAFPAGMTCFIVINDAVYK
jgi:hypothetical protein